MSWRRIIKIIHEGVAKKWRPWSEEDRRFLALALAGEVGELCNLVKKEWRGDEVPDHKKNVELELADCRIYLDLLAEAHGVDLDQACERRIPAILKRWPQIREAVEKAKL